MVISILRRHTLPILYIIFIGVIWILYLGDKNEVRKTNPKYINLFHGIWK